jgi:hypothetical protein
MTSKSVRPIAPRTHSHLRLLLLLPLACLLGCTLPTTPSSQSLTGNWSNWQIQAGTAITSLPTGLYFTGAVQTQNIQSSAVFTNFGNTTTGSQVLSLLGTYNSSTGAVALYPVAVGPFVYDIGFAEPSVPYTVIPVSVIGGCVYPLNYQGPECLAITGGPAVGVEIAPLNGTYTGTFTESASTVASPIPSGTVSLALTQSPTPNASGQFPLTGTLTFTGGGCTMAQVPLSGTVSGEGVALNWYSVAVGMGSVNLAASTNPTASQIAVSGLVFSPSPCAPSNSGSTTYQGVLTQQ